MKSHAAAVPFRTGEFLTFEIIGGTVALLTLNRPEARNAINAVLAHELAAAVKHIEANPALRVGILTGRGELAFCAGADLKEVAAGGLDRLFTADGGFGGFTHAERRKPWIAAINGLALAGGFELMLACDMAVAVAASGFGLPEVKYGLIASAGGVNRLPRVLPRAVALELIATGATLPADRALAFGLVNRVVEADRLIDEALEIALAISKNAPLAVDESLMLARQSFDVDDATLYRLGDAAQNRIKLTSDFAEGTRAFAEKRTPVWTGK